jgi:hypothetical protein
VTPIISSLSILAFAIALAQPAAHAAEPHGHAPGHSASSGLQLDNGHKWATDAPLRRGMSEIRTAVDSASPAVHAGKAKPATYAALGKRVEGQVGRIVAECKLEPKADAMLHLVVADLVAGADAMKGAASGGEGRAGLLKVAVALDAYGKHFDDKAFKPLAR